MIKALFVRTAVQTGGIALILFGSAGTPHWPGAWLFLGTSVLLGIGGGLWLAQHHPDLLAERLKPLMQKQQPRADKIFIVALWATAVVWLIVMGLDAVRYQTSHIPAWVQMIGFMLMLLAFGGAFSVMLENTFAAPVIKVQQERGHHVVTTGLYAYVRHPMYAAIIPFFVGLPLLLGSWWGLAFAPLFIALFAIRAVIEERTLLPSLKGYRDYVARVRYRLIPGIW